MTLCCTYSSNRQEEAWKSQKTRQEQNADSNNSINRQEGEKYKQVSLIINKRCLCNINGTLQAALKSEN